MSPVIARRLGACVNNTTKLHHVLRMSTTATRQQQLASDRYNEHLDRLTLLQAEDNRKLKPVKAKIGDYDAVLSKSLDFLTTLPAALEPLTKSRDTAHTSVERAIAITEAQAQLRKLKDGTLPNLLNDGFDSLGVEFTGSDGVKTAASVVSHISLGSRQGCSNTGMDGCVTNQAFFMCDM